MKFGFQDIVRRSLDLLDSRNRRRIYLLLGVTFLSAVVEVVGIGSIAPFIAVLTDPDVMQSNPYLSYLSSQFEITDSRTLLMVLAGFVVAVSLARNGVFLFYKRMNARYLALFTHHISSELLRTYLSQPYKFFLSKNMSELQRNVIEETSNVVNGVLAPIVMTVTRLIMCVAIVAFLVYLRPMVALITLGVLGGFYAAIYFFVQRRLQVLSLRRRAYRSERFKLTGEGLNGIKPLILSGHRDTYADQFAKVSRLNAIAEARGQIISAIPRYGIESIVIVGMVTFAVVDFSLSNGQSNSLPLMTLYLLASYRLLPALQTLYASITRIRFDSASLTAVHEHLFSLKEQKESSDELAVSSFKGEIDLKDVSYSYPASSRPAVSDVNLRIAANSSIGLVGRSGSGKSTLVDLLLGLIEPQQGQVLVDGIALNSVRFAVAKTDWLCASADLSRR